MLPSFIKRFLPDQSCLLCGALSSHGICCAACTADLPHWVFAHCPICALPTLNGEVCGHCLKKRPHFDRTVAVFTYDFPLDKLIHAMKFGERLELVNFLADSLSARIRDTPDFIVAMPLHPARLQTRGFNQSQLLAKRLSRNLCVPLLVPACRRTRDTAPQSTLEWQDRQKNVRQAFACDAPLTQQKIAMVDDVMTTGASMSELAHTLKQAGAGEVSAWVIARTLPPSHTSGNL